MGYPVGVRVPPSTPANIGVAVKKLQRLFCRYFDVLDVPG